MPVKGTYLAITGGGLVLVWSGLAGKKWSDVLRQLIAGKPPGATTTAYAIAGTPQSAFAGSGGGSNTPSQTGVGPGSASPVAPSASETTVITAILVGLGAPPTPANIRSMSAWRQLESPWNASPPDGAQYTHNPWNTTLSAGSTGSVNSVGVKIYPNWAVGVADTVATLRGYPAIVAQLRSGKGLCGFVSSEFCVWSTGSPNCGGQGYDRVC